MKRIAVIVRTTEPARAREALRAAVGLSLRGDEVSVRWDCTCDLNDADIARALATLKQLGHDVELTATLDVVRRADVVEVWT